MLGTSSLALFGFVLISDSVQMTYVDPVLQAMDGLELESSREALGAGGPAAAGRYLARLDRLFGTRHYLLDATGADVISGQDMTKWLPKQPASASRGFMGVRFVVTHRSPDRRYWLLSIGPPTIHGGEFLPYYYVVVGSSAVLCLLAAVGVVLPIRRLARAMEQFGGGDLAVRSNWRRRDELGRLGRSFDEMADRLERLLASERRLLQDVSHELRSPLTRLTLALKLARTSSDPAAALDRADRHLGRLTALTAEIVEMIRIEGEPAAQRWESVNLGALVAELAIECRAEAEPRACTVHVSGHIGSSVVCDRELVRRALENVLRNAICFSPEGSRIDLELQETAAGVSVAVRDRGPGVPEEALERIFEPFFRVEEARDSDRSGMGLGLSIAKRAIALHGGSITAQNANPGLIVSLALPTFRRPPFDNPQRLGRSDTCNRDGVLPAGPARRQERAYNMLNLTCDGNSCSVEFLGSEVSRRSFRVVAG